MLIARLGPGSKLGLGRCHRRQPILAALDFFGQADAVRNVGLIRLFRQGKQLLHLGLELGFQFLDMSVRERAVPRGVGFDLGAVKTDVTQLEQLHFLGHLQNLQEQVAQFVKKTSTERRQAVVIGMAAASNVAEGHRIVGCPLQLAAGENPCGVAIVRVNK